MTATTGSSVGLCTAMPIFMLLLAVLTLATSASAGLSGVYTIKNAINGGTAKCLIYDSSGTQHFPSRYQWPMSPNNTYCGFQTADLLQSGGQQALWLITPAPGGAANQYLIHSSADSSHPNQCVISASDGTTMDRYMWSSAHPEWCGFNDTASLLANKQAIWQIDLISGYTDQYIIRSALDNQCVIFGSNGQATNPSRYIWSMPGSQPSLCGWDTTARMVLNGQAVWQIDLAQSGTTIATSPVPAPQSQPQPPATNLPPISGNAPAPTPTPAPGTPPSPVTTSPYNSVLGPETQACYKSAYGRGAGTAINSCASGTEQDAALCYPACASGYYAVGPVCWQSCPAGTTDTGVACYTPPNTYGKGCCCFLGSCCNNCPADYYDSGCLCGTGGTSQTKSSYGRGAGTPLVCGPGQEESNALCYTPCSSGYTGIGPVCWADTQPSQFPVTCNAIIFADTQDTCNKITAAFVAISFDIATFLATIEDPDPLPIFDILENIPELTFGVC